LPLKGFAQCNRKSARERQALARQEHAIRDNDQARQAAPFRFVAGKFEASTWASASISVPHLPAEANEQFRHSAAAYPCRRLPRSASPFVIALIGDLCSRPCMTGTG
jgi:hypothetical protein